MEEATLTCELHGYQSSFSPPVWLNMNGSEITTSDKYTISSSDGVNTIVLENGTTLPSVVVSLTIHKLISADESNYTCHGTREESVTQLTSKKETATPALPTYTTTPALPAHATLPSTTVSNDSVIIKGYQGKLKYECSCS